MSYQRIGTPKIYIDNINWLLSLGKMSSSDITSSGASMLSGSSIHEFFDMKPSNLQTIDCGGASTGFKLVINTTIGTNATQDSNFIAILGHNLNQAGAKISLQLDDSSSFSSPQGNGDITTLTNIVNTSSQLAFHGAAERAVYASTKAGIAQFTKSLAAEWASKGVRVVAIAPGRTLTNINAGLLNSEEKRRTALKDIPAGRLAEAHEMARLALLLSSNILSYVVGETIISDGGYVLL